MFFRRAARPKEPESLETAEALSPIVVESQPVVAVVEAVVPPRIDPSPLLAAALRRPTDAASLGFATTADLEPLEIPPGQDRAAEVIEFALSMTQQDFHLAVIGPSNSGRRKLIQSILTRNVEAASSCTDFVYARFMTANGAPRPVALSAGAARLVADQFSDAIASLRETLPTALAAESVMIRRRGIEDEHRAGRDEAFAALDRRAAEQNIAVLPTPTGFVMAPMHAGKVVKSEVFSQLPEAMRRDVEERVAALQGELEVLLADISVQERVKRQRLLELEMNAAQFAVQAAFEVLRASWLDTPEVQALLDAAVRDILTNAALFYDKRAGHGTDRIAQRYAISIMCGASADARPIVEAGELPRERLMGTALAGVRLAEPGLLHRANGGYLIVEVQDCLAAPEGRRALIEAVTTGHIELVDRSDREQDAPRPVPFDARLVMIGDRSQFAILTETDPAFARLFKVTAVFDEAPERTADQELAFARYIAAVATARGLKPIEAEGVAALIEESARFAGHRDRLSSNVGSIADLVCEADHWAGLSGRKTIKRLDVMRAIEEARHRTQALHECPRWNQRSNIGAASLAAPTTGLVQGVALREDLGHVLAAPCTIEAGMGLSSSPPTHHVGMRALAVFRHVLAQRYGTIPPDASLIITGPDGFDLPRQSGCAEVCALLSALCHIPIRPGYAATGGVLASGRIAAVANVNRLIEGYFDAMMTRDDLGSIGIVIPAANVGELMLREDVVDAAEAGRFQIFGAATIEDAMQMLTIAPGFAHGDRLTVASFDRVMREALGYASGEPGAVRVKGAALRAAS